jgi:8-oxo-dGTP pyrophosphatase MutT (NUDIX family)
MSSPERIAIGVVWNGPELIFQERDEEVDGQIVKMYALPGGAIKSKEKPMDALIRELKEEIGLEFKPEDFGKLIVVRLAGLVGYFRKTTIDYGTELKPRKQEKNQTIVSWQDEQIQDALEEDKILPLSSEYISRYL